MKPVLSVAEARAADAAALVGRDPGLLVARAGAALARAVCREIGGTYGRRVVVVAGRGHNGDDGRVAAQRLARAGVRVEVVEAPQAGARLVLSDADAVVDAAYGTGFHGEYVAPRVPERAVVVSCDVPSGVEADTGAAGPASCTADVTVTFAALKPGLLQGEGRRRAGRVEVADIGVDTGLARAFLVEDADLSLVPPRATTAHKWSAAVALVAGSPGMVGAAELAAAGAARAGAGMVRLAVPGLAAEWLPASTAVAISLPGEGWAAAALAAADRCTVLAIGPGLGRDAAAQSEVRMVLDRAPQVAVVDADGLVALGTGSQLRALVTGRAAPTILTPHDGEFARLAGAPPGADRLRAARALARESGAIVLLKGPTTVVAAPDGEARLVLAGGPELATAGSGDVLTGIIAALLASGAGPLDAAALGAHLHGRAGASGLGEGLVASDLPVLVARLRHARDAGGPEPQDGRALASTSTGRTSTGGTSTGRTGSGGVDDHGA